MACVFCKSTSNRSREHVIPTWLFGDLKASQTGPKPKNSKQLTHRYAPPGNSGRPRREWSKDELDLVTSAVCAACNSAWLSDLEIGVKPILSRLVVGRHVVLDTSNQVSLAGWGYKTMLLMQLTREAQFRTIPDWRFVEFHSQRRPPSDVRIWVGSTSGGPAVHEESTDVNLNNLASDLPGFLTGLALGNLYLVCGGRSNESQQPFIFSAAAEGGALLRVWPASVRAVSWPPPSEINGMGIAALAKLI